MAKSIRHIEKSIPNPKQEQTEAITEVLEKLAENREALLASLDILNGLHQAGVLDIINGLLKSRHKVGAIALAQLNHKGTYSIVKNLFAVIEFFSSVDPVHLKNILEGVENGLERSAEAIKNNEQMSLWEMFRSVRDPDVNKSITTFMNILSGFGEELGNKQVH